MRPISRSSQVDAAPSRKRLKLSHQRPKIVPKPAVVQFQHCHEEVKLFLFSLLCRRNLQSVLSDLLFSRVSAFLSQIRVAASGKTFSPNILYLNIWHFSVIYSLTHPACEGFNALSITPHDAHAIKHVTLLFPKQIKPDSVTVLTMTNSCTEECLMENNCLKTAKKSTFSFAFSKGAETKVNFIPERLRATLQHPEPRCAPSRCAVCLFGRPPLQVAALHDNRSGSFVSI